LASYLQYTSTFAGYAGVRKTEYRSLKTNLIDFVEDEINTNVIADEMGISPSLFLLPKPSEVIAQPQRTHRTVLRTWMRV